MKKFVKLSLVAAVAVAGLTTANAKPLEEAIKDVDVSGTVVYRYNDVATDNVTGTDTHAQNNNYKIGLNLSSKVNDDVKLNTRFLVGSDSGSFASLSSNTAGDQGVEVQLTNVNFAYTGIQNTTVKVGKQGLTTPWTVAIDSDSNEQTGTGILALTTWGPVTVAGAYFNQTNLDDSGDATALMGTGSDDIATLGVMGKVGPVALDAWYLDASDLFDSYTLGAKASFDIDAVNLGADLRYTSLDLDNNTTDNDMVKLTLTAKVGIFNAKYAFAKTDKQGGTVSLDNDAATTIQGWGVNPSGEKDATFHNVVLGVQAMEELHLSANYTTVEYDSAAAGNDGLTNDEETEIYAQAVYNMSKNLMTYVRFGTEERKVSGAKTLDQDYKGRLQVQYSF